MRKLHLLFLAGFVCLCAAPDAGAQKTYEEFIKRYKSARELNDAKQLKRAIKKYPKECIWYFEDKADRSIQANDLKAANEVELLKKDFVAAWSSPVLDHIERFRRGLDRQSIARIAKIRGQEDVAWQIYEAAKKSGSDAEWRRAIDSMRQVAEAMDSTGAKIKAARSWLMLASIIDRFPKKTRDDVAMSYEAIQTYVQNHKDWEWTKHPDYAQNLAWGAGVKARLDQPEPKGGSGKGGDSKGGGAAGGLIKYKPGSKWVTTGLKYKTQKRSVEGISLYASSFPLNWLGFFMDGTDPLTMKFFKDGNIVMQRGGAAKFTNPSSGDSKKGVKLGGPKKASDLWYERQDKDGEKYDTNYAFFLYAGSNQEQYNNVTLNYSPQWRPDRKTASVHVKSAAYFQTKVAGVDVTLFDENCNGVFGDKPGSLAYNTYMFASGLEDASRHEIFDSMKIGKGKLVPYSPMVKLGEDWYLLKVIRNNEELRFRPLDGVKTGVVKVDWAGNKKARPKHLCMREVSGAWPDAMFDVMSGGSKGVEMPVGKYEVFYGRIYNGRVPRNMDSVILKGDSKVVEVKAGETTTIAMGAPFKIDGELTRIGKKVIATTTKMWVTDRFGMKYTCLQGEMLEPELVASKTDNGKGVKLLGSWRRVSDGDLNPLSRSHSKISGLVLASYAIDKKSAGKPSFKISAVNPFDGGPSFVGMQQKKHRLFGKLLPSWK